MKLTREQLDQFDTEGYVFLPECFSREEAALLKREADDVYAMDREEVWRESSGVARTAGGAFRAQGCVWPCLGRRAGACGPCVQLRG